MKIAHIDTDQEVFLIAEVGNNHEGDHGLACELVRLAAGAGAHAVKFQTIIPERLVPPSQEARLATLRKFQFTPDQFRKLKEEADKAGILFMSTPFDLGAVDMLAPLVPAFKIASGDNDFFPLIERAAATGRPLIISMGLGHSPRAGELRDFVEAAWKKHGITDGQLAFLHCVVSYPTPPEDAGLFGMWPLRLPGVTVGYSDHTIGIRVAPLAVAAGARIIEKHFTIRHDYSEFRDHQLSANPDEMRDLARAIREVDSMLGHGTAPLRQSEAGNEMAVRRSIAAARSISKGEIISEADLCWLRPRSGMKPGEEPLICGRRAARDIAAGEAFTPDLLS